MKACARVPDRVASKTAWPKRIGTGWKALTRRWAHKVQLVGDDLFVTNTNDLTGHRHGTANSILVKVNQIGSLTETLEAVEWRIERVTLR